MESVVPIRTKRVTVEIAEDAQLRRHALQIVAQLPENEMDALRVLQLAEALVRSFLSARPLSG